MVVELTCTYCGYVTTKDIYSKLGIEKERCMKCNDRHLKIRDRYATDINYYEGCPPFPDEEKTYYITGEGTEDYDD